MKKNKSISIQPITDHIQELCKNSKFKREYEKELKLLNRLNKFIKKYGYLSIDFQSNISKCCNSYAVIGGNRTTKYYICTKCERACDVI